MSSASMPTGDPRRKHAPPPAPLVNGMIEHLHRHFADYSDGLAFVLVDPAVRRVEDDAFDGPLFEVWPRTEIQVRHSGIPETHRPYLVPLDVRRYFDAELLRASVRMAWEDRQSGVIGRSQGHRIGGWLAAKADVGQIARHLAIHTTQNVSGRPQPFRYYDMRCLGWLWPLLRPMQQRSLLGPVASWHILDARHALQALLTSQASPDEDHAADLALDERQWADVRRIGIVNRALAAYQHQRGAVVETHQLADAWAAAGRALQWKLDDPDDAAALVLDALQVHALFDSHPDVAALLKQRAPGQFYRALVSDLEPADLRRIREELQKHAIQGGR